MDVQSYMIERTYDHSRVGKNKARIKILDHKTKVDRSLQNGGVSINLETNHKNDRNRYKRKEDLVEDVQLSTEAVE